MSETKTAFLKCTNCHRYKAEEEFLNKYNLVIKTCNICLIKAKKYQKNKKELSEQKEQYYIDTIKFLKEKTIDPNHCKESTKLFNLLVEFTQTKPHYKNTPTGLSVFLSDKNITLYMDGARPWGDRNLY